MRRAYSIDIRLTHYDDDNHQNDPPSSNGGAKKSPNNTISRSSSNTASDAAAAMIASEAGDTYSRQGVQVEIMAPYFADPPAPPFAAGVCNHLWDYEG